MSADEVRTIVPPGEGRLVRVVANSELVIENIAGGQVGDLFAFSADDPAEHLSAAHTRAHNWRLFPAVGESFVTNRRRPILTLLEDTSPGAHDMLIPACDPERYRRLGAAEHPSCAVNLSAALAPLGAELVAVPQPVNLFMPVPVDRTGALTLAESPAHPGDLVRCRAELDLLLVLSACPQDLVPLNRGGLSALAIQLPA